ncbi:hypothetical protein AURDEDRAFT_154553 [Auricularia subglabra TFB-10046 SS5]|uniref:Uncharacterized protein n=1 Tax=Auricularia subglabra (strain TFB-10046 / SS5) TaxID=717982 RepID=J0WTE8_AURST|nr:hypothetical protein AURDEDRAFT_154553 [Auricularia subglabra TFB-10046 SS5]
MKLTSAIVLALSVATTTYSKVIGVHPPAAACVSAGPGDFSCLAAHLGIISARAGGFDVPPNITDDQGRQFRMALMEQANDPANMPKLIQDVNAATAAAVGIAENFTVIGVKLQQIDSLGFNSSFAVTWSEFRARYIEILVQSRTQASTVAQYAQDYEKFLSFIDPNANRTDPVLVTLFNQFSNACFLPSCLSAAELTCTQNTDVMKNNSDTLFKQFDKLAFDMRQFTGTFVSFAADKIKEDNDKIIQLRGEIRELEDEMGKIFASMVGIAIVAGAGLIGTGIGLLVFPEFAPLILVGAAIASGILLATQAGLLTAYLLDQDKVADKNRQITGLQNELGIINAANSSLTVLAEESIPALANQLNLFSAVWTGVSADAASVAGWLSNGRPLLDYPEFLADWFENPTTEYTIMVEALRLYANGLVIPS